MKKIFGMMICFSLALVILSCTTAGAPAAQPDVSDPPPSVEETVPAPAEEEPAAKEAEAKAEEETEEMFDPSSITQEMFDEAKNDVQLLIEKLNQIIRNRDYHSWTTYLGQNYMDVISDPGFLNRLSESARLKNQKIVLGSAEDYFMYVVVPSRANDRVDDIEFMDINQVKAFTITPKGQRLILYNLEKEGGNWKIVG